MLSCLLLGEQLTRDQLIGFALIIAGGLSLAIERPSKELFRIRRSFWYILISIALWAPVAVLFKIVAVDLNFWDALAYEMIGAGLGAVALRIYANINVWAGLRALTAGTWGVVGMNEIAYLAARGLQFYAVLIGPTALVSVVGGYSTAIRVDHRPGAFKMVSADHQRGYQAGNDRTQVGGDRRYLYWHSIYQSLKKSAAWQTFSLCSFCVAFIAAATVGLQKLIEVFFSIVVRKLFAGLDVLDRIDLDFASGDARLAIRAAGVVDVTRGIVMLLAIDGPLGIDIEQISATAAIGLFVGDLLAGIFDNKGSFFDVGLRK